MATIRPATHSSSWYSGNKQQLQSQISQWFNAAQTNTRGRFGVGPHAGYTYCGATLAHTYKSLDPDIERVFVMGPSHFEAFRGVRTSRFIGYDTPLGTVPVDVEVVRKFHEHGIKYLSKETDEEEHALEMHLPMLHYVAPNAKFVPLLFGDVGLDQEQVLLDLLAPYVTDPATAFVVSSDFCHWGSRFRYTMYTPTGMEALAPVSSHTVTKPIWQSIAELDKACMEIASLGSADKWNSFIKETGNTVCGQRPLGVLLRLGERTGQPLEFDWLDYSQSSKVKSPSESSVSYAAAIAP